MKGLGNLDRSGVTPRKDSVVSVPCNRADISEDTKTFTPRDLPEPFLHGILLLCYRIKKTTWYIERKKRKIGVYMTTQDIRYRVYVTKAACYDLECNDR